MKTMTPTGRELRTASFCELASLLVVLWFPERLQPSVGEQTQQEADSLAAANIKLNEGELTHFTEPAPPSMTQ